MPENSVNNQEPEQKPAPKKPETNIKPVPEEGEVIAGKEGNWKVVTADLEKDTGKLRVENQETYEILFLTYSDGNWTYVLRNPEGKKVEVKSPDYEKVLNAIVKLLDTGGSLVAENKLRSLIHQEIRTLTTEAKYEQPKRGKKTPDDVDILIPGFGVVRHSLAKKELIKKIEDLLKRAKKGDFSRIGKGNFETLASWWETLAKHSGE